MTRGARRAAPVVQARDLGLHHSLGYVREVLFGERAPRDCSVVDIGCGPGDLAAALVREGVRVRAFDRDPECVRAARLRGVEAARLEWPDGGASTAGSGTVDAVLFVRSLHHVEDLRAGLRLAMTWLKPSGRLVVEDFALECVDEVWALWLRSTCETLVAAGLLADTRSLPWDPSAGTLQGWQAWHGDDVHTWRAMRRAIGRVGGGIRSWRVPYLYRYVEALLQRGALERPAVRRVVRSIHAQELRLARETGRPLVGRRLVARRPTTQGSSTT